MLTLIFIAVGATAGAALLGGGNGPDPWSELLDAWEKGIKSAVDDDAKEEEALKEVEAGKKLLESTRLKQNDLLKKLFDVDKRYEATLDDYEPVIEELDEVWRDADGKFLDARYRVKGLLTDNEWTKLWNTVNKKMEKVKKKVDKAAEKSQEAHDDQLEDVEKAETKAAEKKAEDAAEEAEEAAGE